MLILSTFIVESSVDIFMIDQLINLSKLLFKVHATSDCIDFMCHKSILIGFQSLFYMLCVCVFVISASYSRLAKQKQFRNYKSEHKLMSLLIVLQWKMLFYVNHSNTSVYGLLCDWISTICNYDEPPMMLKIKPQANSQLKHQIQFALNASVQTHFFTSIKKKKQLTAYLITEKLKSINQQDSNSVCCYYWFLQYKLFIYYRFPIKIAIKVKIYFKYASHLVHLK